MKRFVFTCDICEKNFEGVTKTKPLGWASFKKTGFLSVDMCDECIAYLEKPRLSFEKLKNAYYQATNHQTEHLEIIKRLYEELNK